MTSTYNFLKLITNKQMSVYNAIGNDDIEKAAILLNGGKKYGSKRLLAKFLGVHHQYITMWLDPRKDRGPSFKHKYMIYTILNFIPNSR